MKNKFYVGMLILLMTILLAGCITIPLGEKGVIKISEAGIEFVKADNDEEEDDSSHTGKTTTGSGGAGIVRQESSPTSKTDDQEEKEVIPSNLIEDEEEDDEEEKDKPFAYNPEEIPTEYEGEPEEDNECNYDYSEFTDHIGTDIYIPYCAILVDVLDFSSIKHAAFLVDLLSFDQILNNYKVFLGSGRNPNKDLDLLYPESILISGKLKDGKELSVNLEQREGYVYLTLDYR